MNTRTKKVFLLILCFVATLGVILFLPAFIGTRTLTDTEHTLLTTVYGETVALDKLRIKSGGPLTLAYPGITLGNTISFPKGAYVESEKKSQALLVHETCHIWQYQHFGLGYIPRSLWELISQRDTYVIHYDATKTLREYDVEEQCEIMAEYFLTGEERYEVYIDQLDTTTNK
jgi:hypothetical protein